ncbi:transmembrane protein 44 isoform X2 [Athene cunicularia]|uniref:transmembrane protein 44 isoform X2 n=1 Tax=Athene cunicularia TaxID=194338 RepID=UPI000EF6B547|nr:transmembrane protein 44 isoform X2 [Athene cunicularia]
MNYNSPPCRAKAGAAILLQVSSALFREPQSDQESAPSSMWCFLPQGSCWVLFRGWRVMLGAAPAGQCWQPVVALPAQRRSEPAMQGTLPVGHSGSAAWPASCLAGELVCVSWGLWTLAALCWITSRLLLSCGCPGQGRQQASILCLLYSFLGHICNTVGALLASQLNIQILTGAYMAVTDLICFLLTLFPLCLPESQRLAGQQGSPGLCPGTALCPPCPHSQDPHTLQSSKYLYGMAAFMPPSPRQGFSTMMVTPATPCKSRGGDAGCPCPLHSPSWLFSPQGSCRVWHSSPLPSRVQGPHAGCGGVPSWGRGLWLQNRLWAAQCRGKPCTRRWLWATLCSATAGVLYAAAIVARDQQPGHILRALPWLLIALGSAALDMALLFVTCMAKSQMGQQLVPEVPDAWALLAGEREEDDRRAEEEEAAKWAPLNMFPKPRSAPRMVAASHCLDLMIRLVQQTGHGMARLPGEAQMGAAGPVPPQPLTCPPLPALHSGLSSPSSSDATSINSELEWDFEDVMVQWSQPSLAAQPCSVLCPGTFAQPATPSRCPEHPSSRLSKQ